MEHGPTDLAEACAAWQGGRDQGSSLLRGAARVLTGIPHYFQAAYNEAYERAARDNPLSQQYATTLLHAVAGSSPRTSAQWRPLSDVDGGVPAGRGLAARPEDDPKIIRAIQSGEIAMPLWGVSLDPEVAKCYGTRFLLRIDGPFHGVAAWRHSGLKPEEQEIIAGGRYEVLDEVNMDQLRRNETIVVRLREIATIEPPTARRRD
jgi:hypothetical protein